MVFIRRYEHEIGHDNLNELEIPAELVDKFEGMKEIIWNKYKVIRIPDYWKKRLFIINKTKFLNIWTGE